ncbi:MAG: PAS domain S-box protein [Fidelibacterota bacterium]
MIRVAIDRENIPYEYLDLDGQVKGYIPDLLRSLEEETGFQFIFFSMTGPEAVRKMEEGKVDLISLVDTQEHRSRYRLSDPHSLLYQALFINRRQVEIVDTLSISAHLVAFQDNSLPLERMARRTDFQRTLVARKEEGFYRLNNNEVGAFITAEQAGLYFIRNHDLRQVVLAQGKLWPRQYCFATRPESQTLIENINQGLKKLRSDGKYDELYAKWMIERNRWVKMHTRTISYTFIGLFVLTLVFLVLTIIYRKGIRQRLRELAESEQLFRSLAEESPNMVFINCMGPVVYVNRACVETTGYTREELTNQDFDFMQLIAPEDRNLIRDMFARHRKGEDVPPYTYHLLHRDGSQRTVLGHYRRIQYSGKPAILGIGTDISDLEKAQNQLKVSERRYRELVEELHEGLYAVDENGVFTYSNRAHDAIMGFPEGSSIVGRKLLDFVPQESREEIEKQWNEIVQSGQIPGKIELPILRLDGSRGIIEVRPHLITKDGKVLGARGMVLDVTETRTIRAALTATELRLESALAAIEDPIFIFDEEGRFTHYSVSQSDYLYRPPEEFLGQKPREVLPDAVGKAFDEAFEKVKQGKSEPVDYDLEISGRKRWYSMLLSPMMNEGRFTGAVGIARDITRHIELEQELMEYRERLEQKVEERTEEIKSFSYSVSHDLKAPLRAITGYTHMLVEDFGDRLGEEGHRMVNVIDDSIGRMAGLLNGLLELSRIGHGEFHLIPLDMNKMVQEVITGLEEKTRDREIIWMISALPQVEGDPPLMRQVWINLIGNAVKFTAGKSPARIEISGVRKGPTVSYTIKDNGAGYNPDYAGKLFGVFERLHTRDEFSGLGIGLALVKRILNRHRGTIAAEGEEGKGAAFTFTLPSGNESNQVV